MRRSSAWWILLAALLIGGLALRVVQRWSSLRTIQERRDLAATQVSVLRATATALVAQATQALSEEYVEERARAEGKMARKGDWIVQPVAIPDVPVPLLQPTPTPTPQPTPRPWETWWALFFASP